MVVLQGLDVQGWTFPIPIGRRCRRKVQTIVEIAKSDE